MAHGLYISFDHRQGLRIGASPDEVTVDGLQLRRELLPLGGELPYVCPHPIELGGHGGDGADLGVHLERFLVDPAHLGVALGLDLGGDGGEVAQLLLSGGEVLLEGDVGGGEALVVVEE